MKLQLLKRVSALVAFGVILVVCLVRCGRFGWVEGYEDITFDWRARFATNLTVPAATNLGFVFIDENSIAAVNNGALHYKYGLHWPRDVYGRLVRELAAQDAKLASFDILFAELRTDHAPVPVPTNASPDLITFLAGIHPDDPPTLVDGKAFVESDDFFAWRTKRAGNVALAAEREVVPADLFRTNALAIGDISAEKDADGKLRRARAFNIHRRWHPLFTRAAKEFGFDLGAAKIQADRIVLPPIRGETLPPIMLDAAGSFDLADLVGGQLPPGLPRRARPFTEERIWHMGVVIAARELGFDLTRAEAELDRGRITLRSESGVQRVLPVDADGYFYIDWALLPNDPRLTRQPIEKLLEQDNLRSDGETNGLENLWRDKLVIVGSVATGNDLTDRGATPLEKDAILVSKHWNVANSIITGRFIRRTSLLTDLGLIVALGVITALLTLRLPAVPASVSVLLAAVLYVSMGLFLYVQHRYWIPLFLPVTGALLFQHISLVTYRIVFEEKERRRIRSVFSRMVSPSVVTEVLKMERLTLGGARREITVLFADVRGFTELTDTNRDQADQFVREQGLSGRAAEAILDEQARETLRTVNLYLALVADMVKKHEGTLDKYIGDCVMAFWGAPTPNLRHATACVHAAIEAQRAIYELNRQRVEENGRRRQSNRERAAGGLPPQALLPVLMLGSGVNTGATTVGFMGSDAHSWNYTVFGREVNVASRLENLSGQGRILIGEATYREILRDDPPLAATCVALPPVTVKGIRSAVNVYEVPWRLAGAPPVNEPLVETA